MRNPTFIKFIKNLHTQPKNHTGTELQISNSVKRPRKKKIQPEENLVYFSTSQKETPMTYQQVAPPKIPNAITAVRQAIMKECACSNAFKRFNGVPGPGHPSRR